MRSSTLSLRERLERRNGMLVPGAANALSARLIEDLGFEAIYVTGAGVTNTFWGLPDLAFVGLSDIALHTAAIRHAVALPLIVDADTGFGNAVNVYHAVRVLEQAGASAIQIEDQVFPKKCGHFSGKEVVAPEEMYEKIAAACEARSDPELIIIGRTDACETLGFAAAVERANRMIEVGADVVFVEAPTTVEDLLSLPRVVPGLHIANMVVGGKTPIVAREALAEAGFAMTLYANAALQGALAGTRAALSNLKEAGLLREEDPALASFSERQRMVKKTFYDALEERVAGAGKKRRTDA